MKRNHTSESRRAVAPASRAGRFGGYPAGAARTPLPNVFFTELLSRLASRPVDLVVALYAFFAIGRRRGSPRYVARAQLVADETLRVAVAAALHTGSWDADAVERELTAALDGLSRDGLLLRLDIDGGRDAAYFLPTPVDRRAMERVRAAGFPERDPFSGRRAAPPAERDPAAKADIVAWYEGAIGTVPPVLVEELREAEAVYPADWIEDAFREAARLNHRSWLYVRRILERWDEEGRDENAKVERDSVSEQRRRFVEGRWRDLVD